MVRERRCILVHLVDKFLPGYVFDKTRSAWPLHITLLPWFNVPESVLEDLMDELDAFASNQNAFISIVGAEDYFTSSGENGVPVNVMMQQERYKALHATLYSLVYELGGRLRTDHPVYVDDAYLAHITHHDANGTIHRKYEGDRFSFDELTLIEWNAEANTCKVLATYHFMSGGHA